MVRTRPGGVSGLHGRAAAALGALLLCGALAGCGQHADAQPGAALINPSPSPPPPAGMAGGACQLLDYGVIASEIGVRFDIAAASNSDGDSATYTCVLQRQAADLPDLSLAVTPTQADSTVFRDSVMPRGTTLVGGLGKIGYSQAVAAGDGAGPGYQIVWLSGNQRLMVLRYRGAAGTAASAVSALLPKLIDLAKKIDMTTV